MNIPECGNLLTYAEWRGADRRLAGIVFRFLKIFSSGSWRRQGMLTHGKYELPHENDFGRRDGLVGRCGHRRFPFVNIVRVNCDFSN
jgi:hypothetical protein